MCVYESDERVCVCCVLCVCVCVDECRTRLSFSLKTAKVRHGPE